MFGAYFETRAVREKWGCMPMAFSSGEEWRRPRHALQKDMFGTDEASSYLPAINEARALTLALILARTPEFEP